MGLDMDLHGLYGVPISPNRSVCITMGFYRGVYGMPMGPVTDLYGSIQILMWVPMGSLWFSMDSVSVLAAPSGSLWGLWGSLWGFSESHMDPYGSHYGSQWVPVWMSMGLYGVPIGSTMDVYKPI